MDNFEEEYFKKLENLAVDFKSRRREIAKSRIKMFAASIYRQVVELNGNFDLLLGAGNSGLFMTKIARMVLDYLNISIPVTVNIPIYRFIENENILNDNSALLDYVNKEIKQLSKIQNILFVDDEIMRAYTANECFTLLSHANKDNRYINATIIAENHFFEWHYKIPKITICFYAYARLIQGINGNIGYFIPEDLYKKVCTQITDIKSHSHALVIVTAGALKKRNNKGVGYFDYTIEEVLKQNIPDYDKAKFDLQTELQKLVIEGIKEYKNKTITFRF